jgi:hypothetical protein
LRNIKKNNLKKQKQIEKKMRIKFERGKNPRRINFLKVNNFKNDFKEINTN